jgi:hypothetical protein
MRSVSGGEQYVTDDVTEDLNIMSIYVATPKKDLHNDSSLAAANDENIRRRGAMCRNLATREIMKNMEVPASGGGGRSEDR